MIVALSKPSLVKTNFKSSDAKSTSNMSRSSVGIGGYAAMDMQYRSSYGSTCPKDYNWNELLINPDEITAEIEALICQTLCQIKCKCKCNDGRYPHIWELRSDNRRYCTLDKVIYRIGDRFKKHTDTKKDLTLIIIPAGAYEDGILHIYNGESENGKTTSFKSDPYNDQIVIFSAYLEHESTEVTNGVKLIYKTSLNLSEYLTTAAIKLTCPFMPNDILVDTAPFLNRISKEIASLKVKLDELTTEKDAIEKGTLTNKIISWIGQLPGPNEDSENDGSEKEEGHIIIGETDPEVQLFLKEIRDKFNIRKIRGFVELKCLADFNEYNCQISLKMGDEGVCHSLTDDHPYTRLQSIEDIKRIVTVEDSIPHQFSVYNDQNYDNSDVHQVAVYLLNRK
jgi:hypothetical protein